METATEDLFVATVNTVEKIQQTSWKKTLVLEGKEIEFKLDSGSDANIINERDAAHIKNIKNTDAV